MTQKEKARVYYDWVVENCEYDFSASTDRVEYGMSEIAYGVLNNHKARYQGYLGAYSLLLKLEGIECSSVWTSKRDYGWTVALLDDVLYYIDTAWGDMNGVDPAPYFGMTGEQAWARFN